jgi:hypothetical protein
MLINPLQTSHKSSWFWTQDSDKPEWKPHNLPKTHNIRMYLGFATTLVNTLSWQQ